MKSTTMVLCFGLLCGSAALAGDYYAGYAAFESGNYYDAYKEWVSAAAEGDRLSQARLAKMFESGTGLPKRIGLATKLYISAADKGHKGSIIKLNDMAQAGNRRAQYWVSRNQSKVADVVDQGDEAEIEAVAEQNEEQPETSKSPLADLLESLFKD